MLWKATLKSGRVNLYKPGPTRGFFLLHMNWATEQGSISAMQKWLETNSLF